MTTIEYEYEASDFVDTREVSESWTEADGLPAGTIAWARYDTQMDFNPHSEYGGTLFVDASGHYTYNDCPTLSSLLRIVKEHGIEYAWQEYEILAAMPEDEDEAIMMLLDGEEGVLAWEKFDFGHNGEGTMYAYVSKVNAITALLGDPKYADPLQYLTDMERLPEIAKERLASEIAEFQLWDQGQVFSVHAANLRTGKESDGRHGIIEDHPHKYLREVALEEARQVAS